MRQKKEISEHSLLNWNALTSKLVNSPGTFNQVLHGLCVCKEAHVNHNTHQHDNPENQISKKWGGTANNERARFAKIGIQALSLKSI